MNAQNAAAWPSKLIGWSLNFVLSAVNAFLLWMTALAGDIFTTAVNWILAGTMPAFVAVGWTIVRDISNMFFILILIVIGLAAILRIESYDYRHLLAESVIMALLVNFSMVIATTLLDTVNVLTSVFRTNHGEIWAFVYRYVNFSDLGSLPNGWTAGLFQGITKIVFTFVALASFLALAGLFVIRIVGVYVLVIFSPLAYALHVLPATKHYAHEWWQYFIKYLIWPPVALFMLQLAVFVAKDKSFTASDSAFNYVILMGFIWGAVIVAEHAGMVGGKAVVQAAEKFSHGVAHMAGGYAGRKWNEATSHIMQPHDGGQPGWTRRAAFAVLNPVAAFKGAQKRSHELSHHAQEVAEARGQEVAEKVFTGTNLPRAQFAERRAENEKLKYLIDMKKEQLMNYLVEAEKIGGHEGETTRLAAMKAALSNGFQDDVLRMEHFAAKYGEVVKDENGDDAVLLSSPDSIQRFLKGFLGNSEQAMRFVGEDMEEAGKNTGHAEYLGHSYFDINNNKWEWGMKKTGNKVKNALGENIDELENTHQASYAAGEWEKKKANDIIATAPHALRPQLARVDKKTGKIITSYAKDGSPVTGEKEIQSIIWGPMNITKASQAHYHKINDQFSEDQVINRMQNVQIRTKDRILTSEMVDDESSNDFGAVIIRDPFELRKIKEAWEVKPDGVRAMYAEKLNMDTKFRNKLTNVRIKYTGPKITIGNVTYDNTTEYIDPSGDKTVIKATVISSRSGGGGDGGEGGRSRAPEPETPRVILTDDRGNPI